MSPGETRPALREWTAVFAYVALWVGYLPIGFVTQQRDVIAGLWVTEALAIALPAVILVRGANLRAASYLGLRAPALKQLAVAVVLAAANQPVVSLLTWGSREVAPAAWVEEFDSFQRVMDVIFAGQAVPMIVTVSVAAPLGEELFFRGFALPALQRGWGPAVAAIVSGAMFSLLHVNKVGFVGLWEIGILLALLRLWSGSLWPSVLCHAVNNGIAGAAFLLGWEDPAIPPPPWFLALGGALLVAGIVLAVRVVRRLPRPLPDEAALPGREPARFQPLRAPLVGAIWLAGVVLSAGQLYHFLPPLPLTAWEGLGAAAALATLTGLARNASA